MKLITIVSEWLTEFKELKDDNTNFFAKYFGNKEFYSSLTKTLKSKLEIESICHQLYKLGLYKDQKLNILLLDILPSILIVYLTDSVDFNRGKKSIDDGSLILRTSLISLRNLLYVRYCSHSDSAFFTVPNFSDGSLYHNLIIRPDLEAATRNTKTVTSPHSLINEKSDLNLLQDLMRIYNHFISEYSPESMCALCELSLRIASPQRAPRVSVTCELLSELAIAINTVIFTNKHDVEVALEVLAALELRAGIELMADAILIVSSIRHSWLNKPSKDSLDETIAVNTMAHNRSSSISENLITNANFRPKKVAEDIETVDDIGKVIDIDKIVLKSINTKIKFNLSDNLNANGEDWMMRKAVESNL